MELSWSTFVLEIINFLVLVWILKRFFYKPVLDVIARRRAGIEKTLADAEAHRAEAEKLQEQYEGRLTQWHQEQQQAREALAHELESERAQKLADLQTDLAQEREKAHVADKIREADAQRTVEETAMLQAAQFASQLLKRSAGPETETRIVEFLIDQLSHVPDERIAAIRNSYGQTPDSIVVVSAFPLADEQRLRLEKALKTLTGTDIPAHFEQDREVLAGLRITIGAWVLSANLKDELTGFADLAHGE